jgi:hypothetical protein
LKRKKNERIQKIEENCKGERLGLWKVYSCMATGIWGKSEDTQSTECYHTLRPF